MRIPISSTVFLTVAVTIFLVTSVPAQRSSEWKTINAEGVFTFKLPVGFKQSETGVDSFMLGYQRGHARFIFVCGDSASNDYHDENMHNLREETTTIDGKHATIRTFIYKWERSSEYVTELNVGDWRKGHVELYMAMDSPDRSDMDTAKQIFKSVKFLKVGCA
jgi:hypothetical protein